MLLEVLAPTAAGGIAAGNDIVDLGAEFLRDTAFGGTVCSFSICDRSGPTKAASCDAI
jgi:hypothetical protein